MLICIYQIRNLINQKLYIGSTKNFEKRKKEHLRSLKNNKHHSIYLQRSYEKYGVDNFVFEILEKCEKENLLQKEQEWINKLEPDYNIGGVGGGDCYTNHPKKEEFYQRLCKQLRECKRPEPLFRENNPNWKGGKTFFICPSCNKEIRVTGKRINQKTCGDCTDRSGENNTFYGKKHSEKSKEKISQSKIGKPNLYSSKSCFVNGILYGSCTEASKVLNIQNKTLSHRLRSKNIKFINYYYIGSEKDPNFAASQLDKL